VLSPALRVYRLRGRALLSGGASRVGDYSAVCYQHLIREPNRTVSTVSRIRHKIIQPTIYIKSLGRGIAGAFYPLFPIRITLLEAITDAPFTPRDEIIGKCWPLTEVDSPWFVPKRYHRGAFCITNQVKHLRLWLQRNDGESFTFSPGKHDCFPGRAMFRKVNGRSKLVHLGREYPSEKTLSGTLWRSGRRQSFRQRA